MANSCQKRPLVSYGSSSDESDSETDSETDIVASKSSAETVDFFGLASSVNEATGTDVVPLDHIGCTVSPAACGSSMTYASEIGPQLPSPTAAEEDTNISKEEDEFVEWKGKTLTDQQAVKLIRRFETEPFGLEAPETVDIVDISVDRMIGSARENVLRGLSTMPTKLTTEAENKPTITAKRKHQITYLAHIAKEREGELEQQWAQHRQHRREARLKYGF